MAIVQMSVQFRIKPGVKHPEDRVWRSCQKKLRYMSKEEADEAIKRCSKLASIGKLRIMEVYECDVCDGWHIGHKVHIRHD